MDRDGWVRVATGVGQQASAHERRRRVVVWIASAAAAAVVVVVLAGTAAGDRLAEHDAVADAARVADLAGSAVVAPLVTDAVIGGGSSERAVRDAAALDRSVRAHVLHGGAVRVKLWARDGTVLWSDEARLVGRRFALDEDEREAFAGTGVTAEVTDLDEPENVHEQRFGRLLEAYRPITTPSGGTVLYEEYFRYDVVGQRAATLWRGFAAVTIGSVLLLAVLLTPLVLRLVVLLRRGRAEREVLLRRALEASDAERRRIAAGLHDGVVQDLVGTSFALTGALGQVDTGTRDQLRAAAGTIRASIAALRTLLVDIYPPTLARAGLAAALDDATALLRAHDVAVHIVVEPDPRRDDERDRLVFRVVQEALRNVSRHAAASRVDVRVRSVGPIGAGDAVDGVGGDGVGEDDWRWTAEAVVHDDGVGFDVRATLASPPAGHFGLRVLRDTVASSDAVLDVRSAPGAGTAWRLRWSG